MAKRVLYGIAKKNANIYEDTDAQCLWAWEVINPSLFASNPAEKAKRQIIQQKIKALSSLIKKISTTKSKEDIPIIVKHQEIYLNLLRKESVLAQKEKEKAEKLKLKENEQKEKQAKKEQENKEKLLKKEKELKEKQLKKEKEKLEKEAKKLQKKTKKDSEKNEMELLKDQRKEEIKESFSQTSPEPKKVKITDPEVDNSQTSLFKFFTAPPQSAKAKATIITAQTTGFDQSRFEAEINSGIAVSLSNICHNKKPFLYSLKLKYINFFDQRIFVGCLKKDTTLIKPFNPFAMDPNVNYENDTEDEYAELTAENVGSNDEEEENDDDDLSDDSKKFVVPDGYLSLDEKSDQANENLSQNTVEKPSITSTEEFLTDCTECQSKIAKFKAVCIKGAFPLKILKKQEKKEISKAPNAILLADHIGDLITLLHGSYYNKEKIINDFKTKFDSISKKSIHKKITEITFKKRWNVIT